METLNLQVKPQYKSDLPIKIMQFGEGNFLRGFIDWMIAKLNDKNLFNGRILALQPTPRGRVVPKLIAQDCLYTTVLHGVVNGKDTEQIEIVNSIAKAKSPYTQWEEILEDACSPDLQFIFSNTTEAGITYTKEDFLSKEAPLSFPAKLTAVLYKRFKHYEGKKGSGLVIMPCELIDDNGTKLKNIVLQHVEDANLGAEFINYLNNECVFLNTLVDRVVSGYPSNADEYFAKIGYKDELMTCGEIFHFMAIEGDDKVKELLPFEKAGLNVVVDKDITKYRLRKVRILNGGHTSNVPAAFLSGLETVDEMMFDEVTGKFANEVIYNDIIPAVNLDKAMLTSFADDVVNRFKDKSMHHKLASILMNCTSKIKARVLSTVKDARAKGMLPNRLCFSLAAYLLLYKDTAGVPVQVKRANGKSGEFVDDEHAVSVLVKAWSLYQGTQDSAVAVADAVFSDTSLWGENIASDTPLMNEVGKLLHQAISTGVTATMRTLI